VELNATGFKKILKKWDKRSKSATKDAYLTRQVNVQACFNREFLADMADTTQGQMEELAMVLERLNDMAQPHHHPLQPTTSEEEPSETMDAFEHELLEALDTQSPARIEQSIHTKDASPEFMVECLARVFWKACSLTALSEKSAVQLFALLHTQRNLSFDHVDLNHRTCLHEAAIKGRTALATLAIECLVQKGQQDVVEKDDLYGRRAMHYAAIHGQDDLIAVLLRHHAECKSVDYDGFSPLAYAIMNGHDQCANLLIDAGTDVEPADADHAAAGAWSLHLACRYGRENIARRLLEHGAKPRVNAEGLTPSHLAAKNGHAGVLRLLASYSTNLDIPDKWSAWTPLFYAASNGHVEAIQALLEAGCNVNTTDENHLTAVYYAAIDGYAECVYVLLQAGCQPDGGSVVEQEVDVDQVPELSLPPPFMPFRVFGHAFLDGKEARIEIVMGNVYMFAKHQRPVHIYGNAKMSSLRLVLKAVTETGGVMAHHTIMLPQLDAREALAFSCPDARTLALEFEVYPTFGSRLIGKATALFNDAGLVRSSRAIVVPIVDPRLRIIGELGFDYQHVCPLPPNITRRHKDVPHSPTADHDDSFIFSTPMDIQHGLDEPQFSVMDTQEFVLLNVHVTKDLVPMVHPHAELDIHASVSIPIAQLTYAQCQPFCHKPSGEYGEGLFVLEQVLEHLPLSIGVLLHVHMLGDSIADGNQAMDKLLQTVYASFQDHQRDVCFASYDEHLCYLINWKQTDFGVFLCTDGGFGSAPIHSIKQAIYYARHHRLLGILCDATPLVHVPMLCQTIRESGLMLVARNVDHHILNVDGVLMDGKLTYQPTG
jgi:CDK inhibitor PHO81